MMIAFSTQGQNLFVSYDGGINEITPGRVQSIFASGLSGAEGLAFNSAGDLFEADYNSGNIYEFTPGGVQSTFASGLTGPVDWLLTARAICLRRMQAPATLMNLRPAEREASLPLD